MTKLYVTGKRLRFLRTIETNGARQGHGIWQAQREWALRLGLIERLATIPVKYRLTEEGAEIASAAGRRGY